MSQHHFGRRPPHLDFVFQRIGFPVWFVTFNTAKRVPWLACSAVHQAFIGFSCRAHHEHFVEVGRYVIMPDHVHLFVSGRDLLLGRWIKMLKQSLAKVGSVRGTVWQEGFFDHLLRSTESYS